MSTTMMMIHEAANNKNTTATHLTGDEEDRTTMVGAATRKETATDRHKRTLTAVRECDAGAEETAQEIFVIPREDFVSAPRRARKPLVLCSHYIEHGSCPRLAAGTCAHFHASLANAVRYVPHCRSAVPGAVPISTLQPWTSRDEVPFAFFDVSPTRVAAVEDTRVHLADCLATAAAIDGDEPLRHCMHWTTKGNCAMGADCKFVHYVAETATSVAACVVEEDTDASISIESPLATAMRRGDGGSASSVSGTSTPRDDHLLVDSAYDDHLGMAASSTASWSGENSHHALLSSPASTSSKRQSPSSATTQKKAAPSNRLTLLNRDQCRMWNLPYVHCPYAQWRW